MARKPKKHPWQHIIDLATAICAPLGMVVEISQHQYEIVTVKGDGVSLIVYPHTVTSTRNQHARVRDNGSKNKGRAAWLMQAMNVGHGLPQPDQDRVRFSCTFHAKNQHYLTSEITGPMP